MQRGFLDGSEHQLRYSDLGLETKETPEISEAGGAAGKAHAASAACRDL